MTGPTALELLWGATQRPRRGPKPSLSLERIVAEAVALADADGLAAVSMQRLAERLGCAKMALYRYVPGKAELTALMLDTALGAPPAPHTAASDPEPWRAALREWATTIDERYRAHPWSIELTPGVRPLGPNELGWMEAALTALAGTGLTGAERLDTVVLLTGHVRSLVQQTRASSPQEAEDELARQVGAVMAEHAERFPEVVAAFADSGPDDSNAALEYGIERILDGVAALIARRAG
ncbi:putative transcriptional regulator, TetR family [Nocardia nova SH22a]|uniref:Putative transcriptional regulator, TetR family n=1 Tax=Nocardia nova SH22a TaxID=1415166 RepID=W5TPL0_9NOCA|nr:TetR/AcrR family transcriptional regulator C-terminal domain-containing protein [Nocardia nova]AHH21310.1 putative transcriptional regulator, TetR family [Nocardia nova SH22a]